jgi:hypothetical protein
MDEVVHFEGFVTEIYEGTDSLFNGESVSSNISYKSFKTLNLPMQNSYCDHRNFDSGNQPMPISTDRKFSENIIVKS